MARKTKGKHRLDKFYHLAKEQGFRSRAAFKLIQLNRQFQFLEKCRSLVDLCAAPGGWLQVAVKHMPMSSLILGIDLVPIKPVKGAKTLVGDITTQQARQAIAKESGGELIDVVLHDGAPNVGGAWASEASQQAALVLAALRLATDVLAPKGVFVTKIFRSQDYTSLLYAFEQLFDIVTATKPSASRNTSAEIFVVCRGYKAPAKIDPALLDPRHLFKEEEAAPAIMGPDALMRQKMSKKRHREGYEEGVTILFRPISALHFIASDTPVQVLGQYSKFTLDGTVEAEEGVEQPQEAAETIRLHPATSREILALCQDLQVLGRSEFKALLKWRMALRKELGLKGKGPDPAKEAASEEESDAEPDTAEAAEAKLLAQMEAIKVRVQARDKNEKRHKHEAKQKARVRAAQMALGEGVAEDIDAGIMFSLHALKGAQAADRVGDADVPESDAADSSDDEADEEAASGAEVEDEDAQGQYNEGLEEGMDRAYDDYLKRHGQREKAAEQKRARLQKTPRGLDGAPIEEDEEATAAAAAPVQAPVHEAEAEAGGGLIVKLDKSRAGAAGDPQALAAQWFSQPLFAGLNLEVAAASGEQPSAKQLKASKKAQVRAEAAAAAAVPSHPLPAEAVEGEKAALDAAPSEDEGDEAEAGQAAARAGDSDATSSSDDEDDVPATLAAPGHAGTGDVRPAGGFEVVPADASGSSDDSDAELDNLDVQGKAELRALAKKMLRGSVRSDMLDGAYHRYAFHDTHMPRWFEEDESRHMKAPVQISRDEVEAEKAVMRAVDARPIKKIAEAKARKRRRLQVRLDAAKAKAEGVAAQPDISGVSKAREINKIMAKARSGKGGKAAKPSRSAARKRESKGPRLDKRMRSDKREVQSQRKRADAKKGGKGGAQKGRAQKGKAGGKQRR